MARTPRTRSTEVIQNIGVVRAEAPDFGLGSISRVAQQFAQQAVEEKRTQDQVILSDVKNQARKRAAEFAAQHQLDPDGFEAAFGEYAETTIGTLDEDLQQQARSELQRIAVGRYGAILNNTAQHDRTLVGQSLQASNSADLDDYLAEMEAGNGAEDTAVQARQAYVEGVQARVEQGFMSQAQADVLIDEADAKARGLAKLAFIKDSFRQSGYLTAMQQIEEEIAGDEDIPIDIRAKLVNRGQEWVREQQALADEAEARAKERLGEIEEETAKAGWELQANGELTKEWVLANSESLPTSEFKALLSATRGDAQHVDDPATINELESRVYAGEDITADAQRAHRQGLLKNDTLRSMLNRNRDFQRTNGPDSDYERARKFIVDQLDPGPFVNDPAARARKANALKMLDDYVVEAPDDQPRTGKEIWDFTKETIGRFALVNWNEISISLPKPKFFVGTRSKPNIAATRTALAKAYANDEIGIDEFNREAAILKRWSDLWDQRQAQEDAGK